MGIRCRFSGQKMEHLMRHGSKRFAAAVLTILAGIQRSAFSAPPTTQEMADQLQSLQAKVDQLQAQSAANAQATPGQTTLGQTTMGQTTGPTTTLLPQAVLPGDITAGYDNGFYLKQGDDFKIQFNGLVDMRYSFEQATNKTKLTTTALGKSSVGDFSGFNLFNGELSAQGYIFKNVFFKAMGNFGTLTAATSPQEGSFEVNELYAGYEFSPGFRVRAGSMIVPYSPLRSITNYGGLTMPDVSDAIVPFLPGYALGMDVLGALAHDTISYDLMIGNGSNSQALTDSTLAVDGRDNRLSVYTRGQFVGSGKLSDFLDVSDVENHENLVWVVGGGFGYETQNSSASAFPGSQASLTIPGLSAAKGKGFAPKYTVNGEVERYIMDVRAKWEGWSFFGEAAYQHIHSAGGAIIPGYAKSSIGETGYFVGAGYFILPTKLEAAGQFSQLYTNGLAHEMDEYEVALNYYPFGENLKVQLAETYVPRAAPLTSNNGITQNTQDWVTQLQVQLKF